MEHEALAIIKGFQHFCTYLEGTKFKIETDHNPLTYISTLKDIHGRLARWALALQPCDYTVAHRSGHANANTDGLSRDQGSLFKGGGMSETYTLTTTEEEGVGDHLPAPVMAATAMETDSENVGYTEVNYENEACGLPLNCYSQEAIMDQLGNRYFKGKYLYGNSYFKNHLTSNKV